MKSVLRVLRARWFVTLIGALALALLVWFVGPLIAVGEFRPLDGDLARMIVVAAILLLWGGLNMLSLARAKKTDQQMVASIAEGQKDAKGGQAQSESAEEVAVLKKRLEEALGLLKKSAGAKGGSKFLYQLPWYMIIGPPGSGKTTALVNSGLNFPLAEKYGKDPVKGVGGTRNCDWWFTDDAVLLDTAGRYALQDSNAEVDQAAWRGFLGLLKRSRPRQPINGALVAISLSDLAFLGQNERMAHARAIRQRLHELQTEFGVRFPVYVMFSKADLIAGFVEFFDDLGKEEREQVWGMTLALDDGKEGHKPAIEAFAAEFDALVKRLDERMLERLQKESDTGKRALIFGFPSQVASLKATAKEFLDEIFMPNRFEGRPLLRGIYLASGTQEGTPIDRLMGAMAAAFGVDRQRIASFSGQGRSYFLTRLLKEVVFAEASVVSANPAVERRNLFLRYGAYAAAALAFIAFGAAWTGSYFANERLIADTEAQLAEYEKLVTPLATPIVTDGDIEKTLPPLRVVRLLSPEFTPRDVPLGQTFGLYQGDKLGAPATLLYRRALENVFLPRLLVRIGQQIQRRSDNPDFVQQGLKVYLMLGGQAPSLDKALVKDWAEFDWSQSFPGPEREPMRRDLGAHLDALLKQDLGAFALDQQVIDDARRALVRVPLAGRAYNTIKQAATAGREVPDWRLADYVGAAGARAIVRISGKPLTDPVPGFYTFDGFQRSFLPKLATVSRDVARESWVLGDMAPKGGEANLERDIAQLYLADYTRIWDGVVADIGLAKFRDMNAAAEALNVLANPGNSPLKTVYLDIARQTTLRRAPDAVAGVPGAAALQNAASSAAGAANKVAAALGQGPVLPTYGQVVDDHFKPLRDWVGFGGTGPAPIDGFIQTLGAVYGQVNQLAQAGAAPKPAAAGSPIKSLPGDAARLPPPLDKPFRDLAKNLEGDLGTTARTQIDQAWRTDVLPFCTKALDNRYPMFRASQTDVNLDDFARLFRPGGLIDAFFATRLKDYVDVTPNPWRWSVDLGIPQDVLVQFRRAATIRELFFANGGATPGLKFELVPVSLDASATQVLVAVDGQEASYSHGPPRPTAVQWPGSGPKEGRVAFQPQTPGQPASIVKSGAWSLFRLFDEATIEEMSGLADRVRVTFAIGSRKATYELRANSVINGLTMKELGDFRCPPKL